MLTHTREKDLSIMILVIWLVLAIWGGVESLQAAPPSRNNPYYHADENATAIREMRDSIENIRHEVKNHETEIRMYDEKLANLDSIIESLRDQQNESGKTIKEQLKGNSTSLEEKLNSLDVTIKGLVADVRQFKTHANDSSTILGQYKQKITELEKVLEIQNQNIEHLQSAMNSMMDALQVKDTVSAKTIPLESTMINATNTYRIKSGDSLEKIARANNTTIQVIKELNGMTSDKIIVGKVIKLP